MSREFLSQVIRSYGTPVQSGMSGYLEQSVRQFQPMDGAAAR
jgi:polyhydroxyalkanoate synthesis regulator protein